MTQDNGSEQLPEDRRKELFLARWTPRTTR